jgi:hypothetical protein
LKAATSKHHHTAENHVEQGIGLSLGSGAFRGPCQGGREAEKNTLKLFVDVDRVVIPLSAGAPAPFAEQITGIAVVQQAGHSKRLG